MPAHRSRSTAALLVAVTLGAGLVPATIAQGPDVSRADVLVREEMERQRIPGLGLAVLKGNDVLVSKGYGLANLEHRVPVTPQTMFESGSMGKMFTAAAVLSLVERGTLDLEASIRTYLPEASAAWEPIRLRHLLTHTSGIPRLHERHVRLPEGLSRSRARQGRVRADARVPRRATPELLEHRLRAARRHRQQGHR